MDEPWIIFMEELRERGEEIPYQQFSREEDMAEAAHEAYEAAAERIHHQLDWDESHALRLSKGFIRVVKRWMQEGEMDWDELEERLERFQQGWNEEMGRSPA
jgi:hypothetical protein